MRLKKIFAVFFWVLTLQSSYSQCFNIESILVDACDSGTNEGFNEMFRMRIGSAPLSTSSMSINWPAQSWLGLIQNATTAAKVNELNDAITAAGGCGQILEPTGGVLPANSTVIVVTSFNLDTTLNSFGALTENIYMLFQNNPSTTAGHFANYNSTPGLRTLTVNFGAGCSDTVTYQRSNLINIFGDPGGTDAEKNGATVNFTPSGTPSYINNGCIAPIPPFTVQVVTFPISACAGQTINLNGSAQGQDSVLWTSTSGNFSSPNTLTTTLTIPTSASIGSTITATLGVTNFCGTTITDQITITVTGNTLTLNSSNNNQNICSGNAITPIQYTFGGGATGVNITGLPAGITATTSGNIVTISGTTSNPFSYTIETVGGCGTINLSGTVTVNPNSILTLNTANNNQNICSGNTITPIQYTFGGGATGVNITGLPAGITATTSGNIVTISGTTSNSFSYTIETVGGCGTINLSGTVTINPNSILTLNTANNNQNICSGNAITPIQYTFGGGATGVNVTGLPAGIIATTSGNIVTISGTTSNSFSYTIETVGGCGTLNLLGTVTANPNSILTLNTANNNQNICSGNTITPIQYTFGGDATGVNVTGLPAGIVATTSGNIVTISGTTSNSFSYTIQTVGGCDSSFQNGAITFSSIITPTFNLVDPICDVSNVVITNISLEGIEGSWSLNSQNSISATFLFTPNPNQCANTTVMTIAIIPSPVVTYSPNPAPSLCSGESLMLHLFSSVPGTTFTWTVLTNGVSGASAGSGNIIDQTLATTSTVAGTAIYTITPSLNGCDGSPIQVIATVNPLPNPILQDGFICVDTSENNYQNYSLTSGINGTNFSFDWYLNGELIPTATEPNYEATAPGNYSLIVTNTSTGCISDEVFATVSETNLATAMTVNVTNAFTDNATITVNVTGGNGSLLYQLDDEGFQESNIFTGVSVGPYQITVIDTQGCTLLTQSVLVIDYPTFFTPNGDGYNDTWNIIGLKNQLQSKIFIFDRYGKLLKQISPSGAGWDGKFNGIELPSTDYWFTVEYQENDQQKEFKAHFSLIR